MRSPRYSSLPFLAAVIRVSGYVTMIIGFAAACAFVLATGEATSLARAIVYAGAALGLGMLAGILLLALSDSFLVLMDIEENTRRLADAALGERTRSTPRWENR